MYPLQFSYTKFCRICKKLFEIKFEINSLKGSFRILALGNFLFFINLNHLDYLFHRYMLSVIFDLYPYFADVISNIKTEKC